MLGEKRSRAAFHGDFDQSVWEQNLSGLSHGPELVADHEPGLKQPDKFSSLQFGPEYPVGDGSWTGQKERFKSVEPEPATETEIILEAEITAEPETATEEEQPADEAENHTPQRRAGRSLRTHDLFFTAEKEGRDFASVLREVQAYLSKEYSSLVTGDGSEEVKAQIRRFAGKYILDHRIAVEGMTTDELIDGIYSEMAEFGFLTKYIYGEGIEEIDVNAWDDVEVQYSGGVTKKLTEHFDSPEHAINVVRRMLHVSGMVLDDASPSVLGHLSKNIRIAVLKSPIVDEDVGVAASIIS